MAEEKKKTGLTEKIGLFIDKTLTFGGGMKGDDKTFGIGFRKEFDDGGGS